MKDDVPESDLDWHTTFLSLTLSTQELSFTYKGSILSSTPFIQPQDWYLYSMSYSFSTKRANLFFDGSLKNLATIEPGNVNDSLLNPHCMGKTTALGNAGGFIGDVQGDFYTGFIYEFKLYNIYKESFIAQVSFSLACLPNHCQKCPQYETCDTTVEDPAGICLIDCNFGYTLENGECVPCAAECEGLGCLSPYHCIQCYLDQLCDECPSITGECTKCIDSATEVSGQCECDTGTSYFLEQHACLTECSHACSDAHDCNNKPNDEFACIECAEGYVKNNSGSANACVEECPTGQTADETGLCGSQDSLVFCLRYKNLIQDDWEDDISNLGVRGGDRFSVHNGDEPMPVMWRGVYFDGADDYQFIEGLILNISFTIDTWIHAMSPGIIFSAS